AQASRYNAPKIRTGLRREHDPEKPISVRLEKCDRQFHVPAASRQPPSHPHPRHHATRRSVRNPGLLAGGNAAASSGHEAVVESQSIRHYGSGSSRAKQQSMNILFLTAYPPVLHMHGGGVLMFHNIRILGEKHNVRVISFVESDEERAMLDSLNGICESVTAVRRIPDFRPHWFSLLPFLVREFSTPEMYQAVEKEFQRKRVDIVFCAYLGMAQFYRRGVWNVLSLPETLSANAYADFLRAVDPVEKLRAYYRWMGLLRYEVLMSRKFDRVVTMTEHDAEYLRSYSPNANIAAIPIGIDLDEFSPWP